MKLFLSVVLAVFTVNASEEVAKLYIATFSRAQDSARLDYWVNSLGLKLSQIAQSFFIFNS